MTSSFLTSLTHPKNIFWLCCKLPTDEIEKAKDLSAPLCIGTAVHHEPWHSCGETATAFLNLQH
jgi:hypothetical protein